MTRTGDSTPLLLSDQKDLGKTRYQNLTFSTGKKPEDVRAHRVNEGLVLSHEETTLTEPLTLTLER